MRYCGRCATELQPRVAFGRERAACPQCGWIYFVNPKVACGVLVVRSGRVLLVQRRNNPGQGLWCLPCGFAEADEPPELAAARETLEETGLHVQVGPILGAYHYTDDPRGAGILLVYHAIGDQGDPIANDDAQAVGFFAADALPPLSHHTHARAIADWIRGANDGA